MENYLWFIIILAAAITIIASFDPSWGKWAIVVCCIVIVVTIAWENYNSGESANPYAAAHNDA